MKKLFFLLVSIFALAACSEDIYQDIDNQTDGLPIGTNSFNDNDPGYYAPGDPDSQAGANYFSPWDIWWRNQTIIRPSYTFTNGGEGGVSPAVMTVIPYIGLAYYDGIEDGWFTDLATGTPVAHLAGGNYPNLYASGDEAGNLIAAAPFDMLGDGTSGESEASLSSNADQMLLDFSPLGSGSNPLGKRFLIAGNVTAAEYNLLADYGKVFYYEVFIDEKATGNQHGPYYLQLENQTLGAIPQWVSLYNAFFPQGSNVQLYYYQSVNGFGTIWPGAANINLPPLPPNWECDSREISFDDPGMFSNILVPNSLDPTNPLGTLYIQMVPGDNLWLNSGVHLTFMPY